MIKLFLFLLLINCSSYKNYKKDDGIETILKYLLDKKSIYYKTINKDLNQKLYSFIDIDSFSFDLCVDNKVIIPKEELKYIKEKLESIKPVNLIKKYPKLSFTKKKKQLKTFDISYPIIFQNGKAAIYYERNTYGGTFNLLIKKNNKWTITCSKNVWIE